MSEMLTEMVPGQEDASDLELLQVRRTQADDEICLDQLQATSHIIAYDVPDMTNNMRN